MSARARVAGVVARTTLRSSPADELVEQCERSVALLGIEHVEPRDQPVVTDHVGEVRRQVECSGVGQVTRRRAAASTAPRRTSTARKSVRSNRAPPESSIALRRYEIQSARPSEMRGDQPVVDRLHCGAEQRLDLGPGTDVRTGQSSARASSTVPERPVPRGGRPFISACRVSSNANASWSRSGGKDVGTLRCLPTLVELRDEQRSARSGSPELDSLFTVERERARRSPRLTQHFVRDVALAPVCHRAFTASKLVRRTYAGDGVRPSAPVDHGWRVNRRRRRVTSPPGARRRPSPSPHTGLAPAPPPLWLHRTDRLR